MLAADVREVYQSICQLLELFLLAVFRSFSDVALVDIVGETPTTGSTPQPQPSLPLPDGVGLEAQFTPKQNKHLRSLPLLAEPACPNAA